jgi:DNA (cytosine-5)-methyltransferase 1
MLTVTDLFCGAGGSSSGAEQVPGVRVRMAANHWALAVSTHNENLPHADHDVANISQTDPRRYPRTDILWASPECTNHSQARGKRRDDGPDLFDEPLPDEAAERSRATMWDVIRFTEHHCYRAVIVENVVDAYWWGPPVAPPGVLFQSWLRTMRDMGYAHRIVWLNSMHAHAAGDPAPQSRDRMYVVFWRTGDRTPDLDRWTRPAAWCPSCDRQVRAVQTFKRGDRAPWGRYRQQYLWRCPTARCHQAVEPGVLPAAAAIDWTLTGERIGDRTRPLAAKTLTRIEAGLRKYALPVLTPAGGTWRTEAAPVTDPMPTRTTRENDGIAVPPLMIPVEGRDGKQATTVAEPLRTQTARNETGIAVAPPFITVHRGGPTEVRTSSIGEPLGTLCASGNHHGLVQPFVVPLRNNNTAKPATVPLDTVAAAGNHHGLVTSPWMIYDYNGPARHVSEPLPTQTTVEGNAVCSVEIAVEDCHFRMLEPHEIKLAMAFSREYVLLGNKREKVRLCGNAVTPPAARDLIAAVAEALS